MTRSWNLPAGDGSQTVFVWYRDTSNNVSTAPHSDAMDLDTTPTAARALPRP